MYLPFEKLPKSSRVWIYQANRALNEKEKHIISKSAESFTSSWAAHGNKLEASYRILYDMFLVIAVNEDVNLPSGCSIDESLHFIKYLEKKLKISLLGRAQASFLLNNEVFVQEISDLKTSISNGKINLHTLYFNNLVDTKEKFEQEWKVPAGDSWLKRYF